MFLFVSGGNIDIERHKNRLLKFCYVPATSAAHNRLLFFFLLPFTVLMKQARQVVRAVKQSIFLDVYGREQCLIKIVVLILIKKAFFSSL